MTAAALHAWLQPWVEILSALLTPVIGLTTLLIAYQQWRVNATRLRVELYDRRFAVFKATRVFLTMMTHGRVDMTSIREFRQDTAQDEFLFRDRRIAAHLMEITRKAMEILALQERIETLPQGPSEQRAKLGDQRFELIKWMMEQEPKITDRFRKYLRVS